MNRNKKFSLFAVYLTFFVDNLSWAIAFPIFAPYFLDSGVFSEDVSLGTKTMVLGFFLMAFSLGQFLGAPLIGEYADRNGRRKALLVSVFVTFFGLLLSAWGMHHRELVTLFIGRLITGIFASSTSVCLSCLSDLSENEKVKAKNFGFFSMIAGLSFVIGAFFGGKLADPTIDSSFFIDLPLWVAALLTGINFLFILFGFRETSQIDRTVTFHFFQSFQYIQLALRTKKIKKIYLVYFLFLFSWAIVFQFIPVLTIEKFDFTSSNIGDLALFMGICWVIGSGYLNKFFVHRFNYMRILEVCLIGFTLFPALLICPKHIYSVLALLGSCVIIGAIAWPLCTTLISNTAPREMQGKTLGISQSIQSFAMTLGPLLGGAAFHFSLQLPFLIAAFTSFSACIVYYFILKHR